MNKKYAVVLLLVSFVIALSIFMPARLARFRDNSMMGVVHRENNAISPESFQYSSLSEQERLYIVSMALGNRNILQSDYAAALREKAIRSGRGDTVMSFAYVKNNRGAYGDELDVNQAAEACKTELNEIIGTCTGLKEDRSLQNLNLNPCSGQLYSAVYMLDPQKNVPVWQIEYSTAVPPVPNDNLPFALMEAYVDAETGKLYGFAFRVKELEGENFEPDTLAKAWLERLGITNFKDITDDNPITENASQYKKFATDGMDSTKTVFMVGYYEGVHEVFVRCY
ncbi:hypothetical protein [Lacrimispora defluvii]|uniref:Uncharacterized protein n=1 Tax=Lacrimispora defluvii TaxID=2719233 RepID=A0ABX1VTJ2_9FIRM|nr:hypothetical protein [Lacrimispora defluvii]NNJ31765.1 hypothetical protein [Lacrimispora defluvii]